MRRIFSILLLTVGFSFGKNSSEKPFIEEHLYHKHRFDFVNASVFQQTKDFSAFYNTTHLFMYLDLSETEQLFINNSLTLGNGLNNRFLKRGFTVQPSGDDLEDATNNINNTGRKYILELWYKRKFDKSVFIAGIIDSASFIDENRCANDEHTQFLNPVLINNPIAPIYSYNPGIYIKKGNDKFAIKTIFIKNTPDTGNTGILQFNFSKDGINIRPYYYHTFADYENKGIGISSDITVNGKGIFIRGGKGFDNNDIFLSAGFQLESVIKDDRIAFGTGYIDQDRKKYVYEIYYLYKFNWFLSCSLDLQIIKERKSENIFGLRVYISY